MLWVSWIHCDLNTLLQCIWFLSVTLCGAARSAVLRPSVQSPLVFSLSPVIGDILKPVFSHELLYNPEDCLYQSVIISWCVNASIYDLCIASGHLQKIKNALKVKTLAFSETAVIIWLYIRSPQLCVLGVSGTWLHRLVFIWCVTENSCRTNTVWCIKIWKLNSCWVLLCWNH